MNYSFATALACLVLDLSASSGLTTNYDPLFVTEGAPEQQDLIVEDSKRTREIPIRIYVPEKETVAPVVLFSHGLGGSRAGCSYLGKHWAARGYVAVFLQHQGSDENVWKDVGVAQRIAAMKQAVNMSNFLLRVRDVPAVLDQLEVWNKDVDHFLAGRLDLNRIGMSGHSFGAKTAQATSGQSFMSSKRFTDNRIKAAVLMSPSGPARGDIKKAFGEVKIPWLLLTGTNDRSIINDTNAASRLVVFPALPSGQKYQLVLDKAEHSAFADRGMRGDTEERNPNHHRAILAVTTAFWDAYLREDAAAQEGLGGEGVRSVFDKKDQWQQK